MSAVDSQEYHSHGTIRIYWIHYTTHTAPNGVFMTGTKCLKMSLLGSFL